MKKMKLKLKFYFEDFVGFARFAHSGDGFLLVFREGERLYALSPSTGRVFEVTRSGGRLFVLIPYGARMLRVPIHFTL